MENNLKFNKILIYGAGTQGSIFASLLHENGFNVNILARKQRLTDIKEKGIILEDAKSKERVVSHVPVVSELHSTDSYDLVMVMVGRKGLSEILPILAKSKNTPNILFIGNDSSGSNILINAVGKERAVIGMSMSGGYQEGNVIHNVPGHALGKFEIKLAETSRNISPRLKELSRMFKEVGMKVTLTSNLEAWLKNHMAMVIPLMYLIYKKDYNNTLEKTDFKTAILAIRENLRALNLLEIPLEPPGLLIFKILPIPVLTFILRKMLTTDMADVSIIQPALRSKDEMMYLNKSFKDLLGLTGMKTPAFNVIYSFVEKSSDVLSNQSIISSTKSVLASQIVPIPAENIWNIISDVKNMPDFHPFAKEI